MVIYLVKRTMLVYAYFR